MITLTPEEQSRLTDAIQNAPVGRTVHAAWEAGYNARKLREFASFASSHGTRTVTVLKALLTIVRPDDPQEIAIVQAAVDLIGELQKTAATASTVPAPAEEAP